MAFATKLTIGTGNKVSLDYQSQDVNVTLSYELERQDTNLLQLVEEKAAEVELVHSAVWRRIRELRTQRQLEDKSNGTTEDSNGPKTTETASSGSTRTGRTRSRAKKESAPSNGDNGSGASDNGGTPDNGNGSPLPQTEPTGATTPTTQTLLPIPGSDTSRRVGISDQAPGSGPTEAERCTQPQQRAIAALARRAGLTHNELELMTVERFRKSILYDLTKAEASSLLVELQRSERERTQTARPRQ